jgi:hypothetical protein
LWALLGPLVAVDPSLHAVFANVPRHNGLEAWRRIAEPINEDKILILKDLLPAVTNPRPATSLDELSVALEAWDTNLRLFSAAGGALPGPDQKRLSFIAMMPPDVSAHVSMHMELPQYATYSSLKTFALKYVKVMQGISAARRRTRPARVVEEREFGEAEVYEGSAAEEDELR